MSTQERKQVATVLDIDDWRKLRVIAFEVEKSVSMYIKDLILKEIKKKEKKEN